MSNKQNTIETKVVTPKTETKVVTPKIKEPKIETKFKTVNAIVDMAKTGTAKNKKDLEKKVFAKFKASKFEFNTKGKVVTEATILRLIGGIFNDVKNKRNGWWASCSVKETEQGIVFTGSR